MTEKTTPKHAVEVTLAEHLEKVNEMLAILDADNVGNGLKTLRKLYAQLEKKQEQIDSICELVGTNHIGNAVSKIKTLMKKEVTIAERFGLNVTFLNEPGKTWSFQVSGKTREEQFKSYTQREQAARAMTRQAYETALQRIVAYCEAEKMKESAIRKEVLSVHNRMTEDYNILNQEAFWYEYCGQYTMGGQEATEPVPLASWLDVCEDYFPDRLIADLRERANELGVISPALHDAWDGELINDRREVAFRVIKTAIEAVVWGSQATTMTADAILHNVLINNGEVLDESTTLDAIVKLIEA